MNIVTAEGYDNADEKVKDRVVKDAWMSAGSAPALRRHGGARHSASRAASGCSPPCWRLIGHQRYNEEPRIKQIERINAKNH